MLEELKTLLSSLVSHHPKPSPEKLTKLVYTSHH
uniref:Uncharacterized protein n=1 Tax=Rhizophora mucronata TaxID=61149 RepID=A0A2P2MZF3_RHIMU